MKIGSKSRLFIGTVGIMLALSVVSAPAMAVSDGKFEVVPPDSVELGNTYGEWSARWWQWLLSI